MQYLQNLDEIRFRKASSKLTPNGFKELWEPIVGEDAADKAAANYALSISKLRKS